MDKHGAMCPECNTVYPDRKAGDPCPRCSDSSGRVLLIGDEEDANGKGAD